MNQGISELNYSEIDETILNALDRPNWGYWLIVVFLAFGVIFGLICWIYQVFKGMGVTSQSNSMVWGIYMVNYLFWISIAHAGIFVSGVLYFRRPVWLKPIVRIAETVTVLSILIAMIHPFFHMGRVWMAFYMLPFSAGRHLWPNFKSPMVFDMMTLGTFLMVGFMLWIMGLLPDLAIVRDRAGGIYKKIFTRLALGWTGRIEQWRDHTRGYFLLAVISIPLVISSHVSMAWNFNLNAGSNWRFFVMLFYFISSSICSGLSWILVLTILVRKVFHFERLISIITLDHFSKIILYAGLSAGFARWIGILSVPGYGVAIENSLVYPSVDQWPGVGFWALWSFNTLMPMVFLFKNLRAYVAGLVGFSVLIILGIWFERSLMIMGRFRVDLLDQARGMYHLSIIETGISIGCFSLFILLFLLFVKHFPAIPLTELKEVVFQGKIND